MADSAVMKSLMVSVGTCSVSSACAGSGVVRRPSRRAGITSAARRAQQFVRMGQASRPNKIEVAAASSMGSFRFEALPPEVRSMIYDLLLLRPDPVRPLCHEDRYMEAPGTGRPPVLGPCLSILRSSRLIHAEASDVLYGRNAFLLYALDFGDAALAFLRQIGRRNRHAIRNLQIDWQHGINKINQTSKASDLFAMISDTNNPLRKDLAKMLHDVGRTAIDRFVVTLELMVGSPRLEHLTLVCPGTDNPGHPDNHCVEYHGCSGCHLEVPRMLSRIKGLKSLTLGDTDWLNELEAMALEMGVLELNVTQLDCIELPPEIMAELDQQGWKISVTWRDPDGDDFRRIATKRLQITNRRGQKSPKRKFGC